MKAVIPCAKKKESLFPFSETKPTALMPVAGKPLVKHTIESLTENGIDEIYLVANYREEMFEEVFNESPEVNIIHQENLDGTASAVSECSFIEDDFIVVNGDVLISENDISRLLDKFHKEDSPSMLGTYENRPEKFGVLSIENDEVKQIEEKPEDPENALVNTGIYTFTSEIFEIIESLDAEDRSLTDAVQKMLESRKAYFLITEDYWLDIGSGEKLWEADKIKRETIRETQVHKDAEISEDATLEGKIIVDRNAVIEADATIKGNCYIGEHSLIESQTVVKDSSIHENTQLNQCSVENSLLFDNNIVDPFVSVENTVLAENCDIKSGTAIRECLIGARSFIESNNSILGTKFVPDARTDIGEISK